MKRSQHGKMKNGVGCSIESRRYVQKNKIRGENASISFKRWNSRLISFRYFVDLFVVLPFILAVFWGTTGVKPDCPAASRVSSPS